MPSLGNLIVKLGLDSSGLDAGATKAEATLGSLGKSAGIATGAIAALGAAAAAAGVALLTKYTRAGLEAVDANAKAARSINATVAGLRAAELAASDAGVEKGKLVSSLEALDRRLGQARQGTGAAADALKQMNINAAELAGMDAPERMATLADRTVELGLSTSETAALMGDLGIRGGEVISMLRDGGDQFREAREEVEEFNLALSDVDAAQVEIANDAMARLGLLVESVTQNLAVSFAPILRGISELLTDNAKEMGGFGDITDRVAGGVTRAIAWILNKVDDFRLGLKGLSLVGQIVRGEIIASLSRVATGIEDIIQGAVERINWLIEAANRLPKVNIDKIVVGASDVARDLRMMAATAQEEIAATREEIARMASEDRMGDVFLDRVEGWKETTRAEAEALVESRRLQNERESDLVSHVAAMKEIREEDDDRELKRIRDQAERNLEAIRSHMRDEEETLRFALARRLDQLKEAHELDLIEVDEYDERKKQLREELEQELAAIAQRGADAELAIQRQKRDAALGMASSMLSSMSGLLDGENRRQFAAQQALATSATIVSGVQAAARAFAIYGPTPMGYAGIAAAAATTADQVAAIARQTYGSGAAGGVPAPTTPSAAPAAGGGGPAGGTLTVAGLDPSALFTGATVAQLAEELLDYQAQGGRVVLG